MNQVSELLKISRIHDKHFQIDNIKYLDEMEQVAMDYLHQSQMKEKNKQLVSKIFYRSRDEFSFQKV